MADLNKVFLMGRLTFDPELRRTPSGTAVTELRLATTRTWPGRDGERREETLFIGVTVWDRQAETCCQYLRKGSAIHVEGSLKMDTWDDKTTGEKRSKILIHADRVQFLDPRNSGGPGGDDDYGGAPASREPAARRGGSSAQRAPAGSGDAPVAGNGPAQSHPAPSTPNSAAAPAGDDPDFEDIPF